MYVSIEFVMHKALLQVRKVQCGDISILGKFAPYHLTYLSRRSTLKLSAEAVKLQGSSE